MSLVIIAFGVLTLLAGVVIVINPDVIFSFLRKNLDKLTLHVLAVVVRFVLGLILLNQASVSRYPLTIEIIGGLSIVAAVVLAVIGRRNFSRLMFWSLTLMKPVCRIGGVIAAAFGAFLIYAFVV